MKNKAIISYLLAGILLFSIISSDLTKGILASDQLEIKVGSIVDGKLLISTSVAADVLQAYVTISDEKVFIPADISDLIVQIQVIIKPVEDYGFGLLEDPTELRLNFLAFYDNRTTIILGSLYTENATESIEMTVLHETKYFDMINPDNRKITFKNGTTALAGSIEHADPKYILLEEFSLISDSYLNLIKWTIFAISPTAVIGDDISYTPVLGLVIGTPAVTTTNGDSYDAILVEYYDTRFFNTWGIAYEVHAYYEAATGFLVELHEELDQGTWKFIPGTIDIVTGIPFAIEGVIVGLAAIGLIATYIRKRK